ncbi:hypothetical protein PJK45_04830 [Mycobacterium kansasii]|uniref:Uncharacterized protein n=2 Tax=Mycobacterium kansasii TaxID=1768 RepID=A0A1V3XFH8_MYCKA|nr:hypothetical protein [Mycobacterium kansasii]ETZ98578.1 hypothetical protein I547_6337 [Mycobacterium kansasii 824]ARG54599.1 hypothetical protein B1T43_00525 [Mycobacterium kansasii]ARG60047.1 hypothetical protein B1T45_00550 [Mycobacterium kansasii]ARG77703.1 hypothetical protein B1T51_28180 [Mycobacterium kansasii]ARG83191.1 hypothetical protein B1T52_28290 [Mycobacterium kansasii]
MPRRRRRVDAGGSLRAFLAGEQRNLYGIIDGLYRTAGAIESGGPVRIHRYDLPDDHPERCAGEPGDDLILGADDELRPA